MLLPLLLAASTAPSTALADDDAYNGALDSVALSSLHMDESRDAWIAPQDSEESKGAAAPANERFGKEGQMWWSLTGGPSFGARDTDYWGNVSLSLGYFIADDFEVTGELGGWWFVQDGPNAEGLSLIANFRWHALHDDDYDWTAYIDAGIGILGSTQPVPATGLSFNFMPRAGVGFTHKLGEGPERLIVGARWQHISNARLRGSERNPGRDAIMIYAGIEWPF